MLNGMLVSFPKKKKTKIENYIKIYEQKHTVSSIIIIMPNANKYGIRWVFSDMWRKILDLKKTLPNALEEKQQTNLVTPVSVTQQLFYLRVLVEYIVNNTVKDRTTDGLVVYIGSDCFVWDSIM